MNKFRNNLHPAFYDVEKGGNNVESLEMLTLQELAALKNEVMEDISGKKRDRISGRQQENTEIWNQNIIQGYGRLVAALRDNHYFDGKNQKEQAQELSKIKEQYQDEVKKQYKKIVGKRSDKKFESEKNSLFDFNSPDSPANKIYTQLTGAATISRIDRQYTEGYDVDFLDAQQINGEADSKAGDDVPEVDKQEVRETEVDKNAQQINGKADSKVGDNVPEVDKQEVGETEIDKKNRKFLSNDLPEYLWNIRKTPGVLNVIKWLPIFSVKVDRPSEVDRDAISNFLEVANRLPVKKGKSPVMVLLEALHDDTLNTNSTIDTYAIVLQKHGMDLDGFIKKYTNEVDYKQFRKCMSEIMKVGSFYINTQRANNDVKDQHAIYLSVLKIIETSGGANKAVDRFEKYVEKAKADKKTEKKEGYEAGKDLSEETLNLAKKLGITDFTSVTRLFKKGDTYFSNTSAEKILANINNDSIIDARDTMVGGTKTGSQFIEIFNRTKSMIGEDKVFNNLLDHAKLINQTLGLGLDKKTKFTKEEINGGNKELILLLQDIISKPGEDLFSLMLGETGAERVTRLNAAVETENEEIKEKAKDVAKNFVEGINYEEIKQRGLKLPTPEEMQSGLAATLYSEYKRGVGLGGKISFDDWVKGLELNTGVQVREDGKTIIGIGLDYHKVVNLGKGWTLTPELAAGAFIPLFDANPDGSGGVSVDVAKSRLTPKGTVQSIGLNTGVTYTIAGVTILSAGINWNRDKAADIEKESENKKGEMQQEISGVLNAVLNTKEYNEEKVDWHVLDLTNPKQVSFIKSSLENLAKHLHVSEKDIPNVVDATMRLLAPYNGVDLKGDENLKADKKVIEGVASGVAEQFAMAWSEYRKAHVSESAYLSGANLGAFWVVGSPLVGIYAGVKFNKHDLDGYGDRYGKQYSIDNSKERTENGIRTPKLLQALNARLGLSEGQGLSFVEGNKVIKIPKSIINRVKVSESMKKLLVKDQEGNILVSSWTKMGESIVAGAATQSRVLLIGERKDKDGKDSIFASLNAVRDDWFASDINEMSEKDNELFYTPAKVVEAINELKGKINNPYLNAFNPTVDNTDVQQIAQESKNFPQNKKVKITIERQPDGQFKMGASEGTKDGKGFELEYKTKLEMFGGEAAKIATEVYAEALKVVDPKVLNEVKHNPWDEWTKLESDYDNLVKKGSGDNKENETAVKETVKAIFAKLDDNIIGAEFSKKLTDNKFDNLTGDALIQTLMSIKNIFARSKQVRGSQIGKYEFKGPKGNEKEMRKIIGERSKILDTLKTNVKDNDAIKWYTELFNATSEYVEHHGEFAQKSAEAAHLGNTVGFNLGDKTKPENPLFNPEIYNPMVDLDYLNKEKFPPDARKGLHKRAMKMFAENPALVNPVLQTLGIDTKTLTPEQLKQAVENGTMDVTDDNKCQLTLDIGGKKITLSSGMNFGFFTQCVNHTIILSDISAESDELSTNYSSRVWENGKIVEKTKSSQNATTTVGGSVSVTLNDGRKKNEESFTKPTEEDRGKIDKTDITGAEEVTDQSAKDGDEGEGIISLKW